MAKLNDFPPGIELKVIHIHPSLNHEHLHVHTHEFGTGREHAHIAESTPASSINLLNEPAHEHEHTHHQGDHPSDEVQRHGHGHMLGHCHLHKPDHTNNEEKPRFSFMPRKHQHDTQSHCGSAIRRRLMEMGIVPGAVIMIERLAPLGDPIEIRIGDSRISLRKIEAAMIEVIESN